MASVLNRQRLDEPLGQRVHAESPSSLAPEVAIVRRRRVRPLFAWVEPASHVAFVALVVALSVAAETAAARVAVILLALAYGALHLGRRRSVDREVELTVDALGVRQSVDGRSTSLRWDDAAYFSTSARALAEIGLFGHDGRCKVRIGAGLDEDFGPVSLGQWRLLARAVRDRLEYREKTDDTTWGRSIRPASYWLAFRLVGVALCLSPPLVQMLSKMGGPSPTLMALGLLCLAVALAMGVSLVLRAVPSDFTASLVRNPADRSEGDLQEFLADRNGRLDPIPLELTRVYRYVAPKLLFKDASSLSRQTAASYAFLAMIQTTLLIDASWVFWAVLTLPAAGLFIGAWRLWVERALLRTRDATFSFDGPDLVVRWNDREERYPRSSARPASITPFWAELGGEVEEYRAGRRRVMVDRRFLVPIDAPFQATLSEDR